MSEHELLIELIADIVIALYDATPSFFRMAYLNLSVSEKVEKLRSLRERQRLDRS